MKRTLLIIDDDDISRGILKEILSDEFNVLEAPNGLEGMQILKEKEDREISLIVLDLHMPVMDGHEFLKIASQDPTLSGTPIIVTTSSGVNGEELCCLQMGALDFISKPYEADVIRTRIHNIIRLSEFTTALLEVEVDPLTGLYSKNAFLHYSGELLKNNPEVEYAMVGIDIDNFKLTNSQYGEESCDLFLNYFGKKLKELAGEDLAGRFSGDQFVVMTPRFEKLNRGWIGNKLTQILQEAPIPNQGAKIGVYYPVSRQQSMASACDRAFWAIKKIKGIYKENIAFYTDEVREQQLEERKISECMEAALEKGQFVIYYQPKHNCMTGRVAGAEALVRWEHPEYGFMSPARFIPLFEQNGFISKLDSYVLERVCRDLQEWEARGIHAVPISTNFSRRDFFTNGWIKKQLDFIVDSGINPELLHMEVTESFYTDNPEEIVDMVDEIRDFGCKVEMDDFGSGYSALGMLTDFPFDVIKLDLSFIRRMEKNELIIDTVIKLAHRMGFQVVAEGVETEKQYLKLKELQCDFIQGYYFSKPLPREEFIRYLEEDRRKEALGEESSEQTMRSWSELTNELEIKNTLLSCVNMLNTKEPSAKKIRRILSIIAKFYGGDRAYLIEIGENQVEDVFEWTKDGFASKREDLLRIEQNMLEEFNRDKAKKVIEQRYLPSIEGIRESHPVIYQALKNQKIKSFASVPILAEGEVVGTVGVDNPTIHTDAMELLTSAASFLANELERNRYIMGLERISYKDSLTGLKNRRAYYRDIEIMEQELSKVKQPIGLAFADINGLKQQNDRGGHDSGDRLICQVAQNLERYFDRNDIYRIGGDEFVVFAFDQTEREFEEKVEELRNSWDANVSAAIGTVWLTSAINLEKNLALADKAMYKEKRKYYENDEEHHSLLRIDENSLPIIEQIAESMPGGFFLYHADGNEELIYFNQEIVRMFGCKNDADFRELTGNSFRGMVHPDDLRGTEELITSQIQKDHDTDYVEYRILCRDNSVKYVRDYGRFVHSSFLGDVFYVFLSEDQYPSE